MVAHAGAPYGNHQAQVRYGEAAPPDGPDQPHVRDHWRRRHAAGQIQLGEMAAFATIVNP
jgi:hypothetical protein